MLLVSLELSVGQSNLLPRLECRHSEIWAAGTAKCITKVALRERE